MKLAYAMMALGGVMILYVRGGQFVTHMELTEMQALIQYWPTYLCGSVWILLGVLRMRLALRQGQRE